MPQLNDESPTEAFPLKGLESFQGTGRILNACGVVKF